MDNEKLFDLLQDLQDVIEHLDDIKDELSDLLEDMEEEASEAASCDEETGDGSAYLNLRDIYDLVESAYVQLNEAEEQMDELR